MTKENRNASIAQLTATYRRIVVCPAENREKLYGTNSEVTAREIFDTLCNFYDWENGFISVNVFELETGEIAKNYKRITRIGLSNLIRDGFYAIPVRICYEFSAIDMDGQKYGYIFNTIILDRAVIMDLFNEWVKMDLGLEDDNLAEWNISMHEVPDEDDDEIIEIEDDDEIIEIEDE